jgi:hypothetical protein
MISRAIHVDSCNKSALSKLQITPTYSNFERHLKSCDIQGYL